MFAANVVAANVADLAQHNVQPTLPWEEKFKDGVFAVFRRWALIRLVIDQELAGTHSRAKVNQLFEDLVAVRCSIFHWRNDFCAGMIYCAAPFVYVFIIVSRPCHPQPHQQTSLLPQQRTQRGGRAHVSLARGIHPVIL